MALKRFQLCLQIEFDF